MTERIEVQRTIAAPAADIFAVLCDDGARVNGTNLASCEVARSGSGARAA